MITSKPNDRAIARFTMAGHALVHWFETAIPIFLVVWLAELNVSVALLGVVVAIGYAPFGLGALPGGILADRYGTKRLILLCLFGMSASFLILALTTTIYGIAVGLVCWGIAASIYHPSGLSLISTGVEDRGSVFAWHGIAGNIGIALGPFVAATLLLFLEWNLVALLLAIPGFLVAIYGLEADFNPMGAVDPDTASSEIETQSLSDVISNSRTLFASAFAVVFVLVTFEGLFYRGMLTYLPEVLHGSPAMEGITLTAGLEGIEPADYIYVGLLVVGMAGQYVGGKLTTRISASRGLLAIFTILSMLALLFIPVLSMGLGAVIVLCSLLGFFLFAIQPFYQEAVAVYTPPDGRGLSYGYTYLGEFGLGSGSIALGGFIMGAFSVSTFFVMLATFGIVGAGVAATLLIDSTVPRQSQPADAGQDD